MSLLFCSANSIARFSVSCTAPALALAAGACDASCATAGKSVAVISATRQTTPPHPFILDFLGTVLTMRASSNSAVHVCPEFFKVRPFYAANHKLFVPQRLNRLQPRRLVRRQIPEKKPCRTRNPKRNHHADPRDRHAQISRQQRLDDHRNRQPNQNAQHRAAPADQKRLNQKLIKNL